MKNIAKIDNHAVIRPVSGKFDVGTISTRASKMGMSPVEALGLLHEWKVTGAKLVGSGKNADGSGILLPAATVKSTANRSLTLLAGNSEMQFDLSAATFGKSEGIPENLLRVLITSVSISFPNGAQLALCELAR